MSTFSQTIGSETKASPINALSMQSLPAAKGCEVQNELLYDQYK